MYLLIAFQCQLFHDMMISLLFPDLPRNYVTKILAVSHDMMINSLHPNLPHNDVSQILAVLHDNGRCYVHEVFSRLASQQEHS